MGWNEDFENDSDQDHLMSCPSCGAEIYDESEQCPYCGEYVLTSASPFASKPTWVQWLFVIIVIAIVLVVVFPFCW